ncbi:hypothetical protein [Kribbella sp. NPDC003557]|uniref:hypothetical protein n=1 Tax=Kribbella sp. NPDC003557 TaxID=3154449 RepID=UPI0033AC4957
MASQRKLPEDWLNTRANPWMPPLPEDALQRSGAPGLHITYASDEFLLATKLVAQRRKDASDIINLAGRLHLGNASADDLEQLIRRYYTDEDSLEFILGGDDVSREVHLLAVRAEKLLARQRSEPAGSTPTVDVKPSAVRRSTRSTTRERD